MKNRQTYRRGFSVVELIIYMGLAGIVGTLVLTAMSSSKKAESNSGQSGATRDALVSLAHTIVSIGRVADSCTLLSTSSFQCAVTRAGSALPVTVKFERVSATSPRNRAINVIQMSQAGVVKQTYPSAALDSDVTEFEFCDGPRMTAGTCPVLPVEISTRWANIRGTQNSFFRFRIKMTLPGELATGKAISSQSAFFIRNATLVDNLSFRLGRDQ